jgi:RNA polymerase sigma factor (sigma-70 family)
VIPEDGDGAEGAGRSSGFDEAFDRLFLRAYRASFQIVRSREDAEDVAMDTMARALRQWDKLDREPDGWVTRVATNRSIDVWRRAQRQRRHHAESGAGGAEARTADDIAVRQALCKLSKRQREVVTLRYFMDLSEQEIAHVLGCSTGSVKQHASRGLSALRRALSDEQFGGLGHA